ncbi:MAG TPA: hypothetical protein VFP15_10885 [Gemmatimonadaceae bacterium]|nr:hypothetical protein [Gemmatimonadaceae bacterium]
MPRTLVLFHGNGDAVAAMAEAVAEGVRSVRFAEVDVRQLTEGGVYTSGRVRPLGSAEELATYDGLILGTTADKGEHSPVITRLLAEVDAFRTQGPLGLLVGAAFAAGEASDEACWALLRELGGLGLVLVPPGASGSEARKLGHRMAHVVSWITHARSHHH